MTSLSLCKLNKHIISDDIDWARIAGIPNAEREFAMEWLEREKIGSYIEIKMPKNRYKLYYFINENGAFKLSAIPKQELNPMDEW
jgi:hypothetical protein